MKNPFLTKLLFLRVRSKDPEAYGQFYDLYVEKIYRFIYFKVSSTADAQDLTADVFLKFWQAIRDGKEIKNLNAFIYMIARNAVIDFYRQRQRQGERELSLDQPDRPQIEDLKTDLIAQQLAQSDLEGVARGLQQLKDEYREVIVLRYMDDLSLQEVATILNKSNGSVRTLLHRATKALKEAIHEESRTKNQSS